MDNLAVSMQGITKIFNGVKANDNVDFNLRKGSIHGLLGENGAGKTTLMNILYGLYQQEAGDIYINGSKEEISSPIKAISLGIDEETEAVVCGAGLGALRVERGEELVRIRT